MDYDEMIAIIKELNALQEAPREAVPHGNNLIYQFEKKQMEKLAMYQNVLDRYIAIRQVPFAESDIESYVASVVEKTNEYMNLFWPPANNPFSHQADFTSSIIPEMLCSIFGNIIKYKGVRLEVSAQRNLAIECIFDAAGGGKVRFKNKRVDVAVIEPCNLLLNGNNIAFPIPILAIECKTNLDKNMLSGIEQSVEDMKKTFPKCKYFVITECADFDAQKSNYASSGIDEIYILRKQKRHAVRLDYNRRNPIDGALIYGVTKALVSDIDAICTDNEDLNTRMQRGKLIGRE